MFEQIVVLRYPSGEKPTRRRLLPEDKNRPVSSAERMRTSVGKAFRSRKDRPGGVNTKREIKGICSNRNLQTFN